MIASESIVQYVSKFPRPLVCCSLNAPVFSGLLEESFGSHHDSKPFGPSSVGMDLRFERAAHVYGAPPRLSLPPLCLSLPPLCLSPLAPLSFTRGRPRRARRTAQPALDHRRRRALLLSIPAVDARCGSAPPSYAYTYAFLSGVYVVGTPH